MIRSSTNIERLTTRHGLAFAAAPSWPPQPGDALFLHGTSTLDRVLQDLELANGQPSLVSGIYPCHVGMTIADANGTLCVGEMQWPVCRILPFTTWIQTYGTDQYWMARLKTPLTTAQVQSAAAWWQRRVGNWYDLPELLGLGLEGGWNALCARLHLPLSCTLTPIALKGVCSVNVAWAYIHLGLSVPTPLRQSPSTIIDLPFLDAPIRIA